MKQWTLEMISACQLLNDFAAGLICTEQWMADLFETLELKLPINIEAQPDWATFIEVCATAPFVPIGSTENEFIIGMQRLERPRSAFVSYVLFNHLLTPTASLPNTSNLCDKCGRTLPSIRLVNTPEICIPRCN